MKPPRVYKEFRFAVGGPTQPSSCSWKLWSQGNDVYLLQRNSGDIQKFSFHKSGICRWASISRRPDGSDRAVLKWARDQIPEAGTGQGCRLVSLAFPTNHLSASHSDAVGVIQWIDPAKAGKALAIDILLTHEPVAALTQIFARTEVQNLLFMSQLKSGASLCVTSTEFECGKIEFRAPRNPNVAGQVFGDLVFPDLDATKSGRPVRMLMIPQKQLPPMVWELGGYEIANTRNNSRNLAIAM